MTKNQRLTFSILAGLLVIMAIAFLLLSGNGGDGAASSGSADSSPADSGTASSASASGSTMDHGLTAIAYNNGTASLSFARDDSGSWYWVDDPTFPLDESYLTKLESQLTDLSPIQSIQEGDTLEAYGLDKPSVTLTAEGEDALSLTLGNLAPDGSGYYMLENGDESTVYVVGTALYEQLNLGIYSMMKLPELPVLQESDLRSITIEGTVSTTLTAEVREVESDSGSASGSSSTETPEVHWFADDADVTGKETVLDVVDAVLGLTLDHCELYHPSDEAMTLCGFDAPAASVTVRYVTEDGEEQAYQLSIGNETAAGGDRYVRLGVDTTLYGVSSDRLQSFLTAADSGIS